MPALAQGAQVKVNLMLRRLPRLRDETVTAEQAFGGTFHINETLQPIGHRVRTRVSGRHPRSPAVRNLLPLPDRSSILSPELRDSGAQTLTVFGLHTPHSLLSGNDPGRDADPG